MRYIRENIISVFLFLLTIFIVVSTLFAFYKRNEIGSPFTLPVLNAEADSAIVNQMVENITKAFDRVLISQCILLVVTLPLLMMILFRFRSEKKINKKLVSEFRESNLKYVFNSGGKQVDDGDNEKMVENSTANLKNASTFIKDITSGNYETQWAGLTKENAKLNEDSIVGNLIRMRDEMKRVKEEDQRRLWVTDGLAQFSELVRNNQDSISKLADAVVIFLTKHLRAQQGSLFLLTEIEGKEPVLTLSACYAFDKKKYVEKVIPVNSGLVGQTYLDRTTTVLKQVPRGYTHITSGLGDSTPSNLVIIPMMYNERVESVFEVAGFEEFQDYQVQFLEKAGEFVASAIHFVRTNERTAKLLQQSQQNAEMLREQEEEMRQNMEELEATQEEMARKERELNTRVEEIQRMKDESVSQSKRMIETVEKSKKDVMEILNHVPEVIFLKDSKGYMVICNEHLAKLYKLPIEKIIGTHDYDFYERSLAQSYFDKEQEIIRNGAETFIQEDSISGEKKILKTVKMPFYINHLDEVGLLGVQSDITLQVRSEQNDKRFAEELAILKKENDELKKLVNKN